VSSEVRLIRPFDSAVETQSLLEEGICLEISCDDQSFELVPGTSMRNLDPRTLLRANFVLRFRSENGSFMAKTIESECSDSLGIDADDIRIAVVIKNRYLKRVDVQHMLTIGELRNLKNIPITSDLRRSIHNGWTLTLAVVLNRDLPVVLDRATRRGSWLAKVEFQIASPREGVGFTPLPLTDELREQFRLGLGATRYALLKDGVSLLESSTVDEVLEYYVDENLLTRLSADSSGKLSKLEQVRIFLDAASFVVAEATRIPGFGGFQLVDLKGTILEKFLILLVGEDSSLQREWLVAWQQTPSRFMAGLEDACELKTYLDDALGETS
jgi:hypothetical protein